jgi:hypothetical protein
MLPAAVLLGAPTPKPEATGPGSYAFESELLGTRTREFQNCVLTSAIAFARQTKEPAEIVARARLGRCAAVAASLRIQHLNFTETGKALTTTDEFIANTREAILNETYAVILSARTDVTSMVVPQM